MNEFSNADLMHAIEALNMYCPTVLFPNNRMDVRNLIDRLEKEREKRLSTPELNGKELPNR